MDGRGGCCIARYVGGGCGGGGGGGGYDTSKVDRIMLRFRPIAPKPVPTGSVPGDSTPEKTEVTTRNGRGKRKFVKDSGSGSSKRCNRKKKAPSPSPGSTTEDAHTAVTLPLLPETPEQREYSPVGPHREARNVPVWLSFESGLLLSGVSGSDRVAVAMPQPVRTVASCVTVECLTDTWVDGEALGCTDGERKMNLERDTCPGFISDGLGKVTWTNEAYRKMVGEGGGCETRVRLVVKDKESLPEKLRWGGLWSPAFTCKVKVQYTCRKEKNSLTVPCDVWRMDSGGYAWKLDVKAALSLGR